MTQGHPASGPMSMTFVTSIALNFLGIFQPFCEPATHEMLEDFLLKAQALGHPNLVVAFVQDSSMAVCLLQELHSKDSLRCLPMEPKPDAGGKTINKLSFCLLCLYNGSNDLLYMNHIMCGHYNANDSCGKCLKEVFIMGQQLKNHLKICTGFPKASTPSSSEKEAMPQGSQESSQVSLHHNQHPKKKKSDSAKKFSGEGSLSKAHKKSKCHKEEMPKKEKHNWWDKADKSKSHKSHKK